MASSNILSYLHIAASFLLADSSEADSDNSTPQCKVVDCCVAIYRYRREFEHWKLSLDLKSFEVMHGISRIVKLLPDKMATAMAIQNARLPGDDDGHFLIDLMIELVQFYRGILPAIFPTDYSILNDCDVEERYYSMGCRQPFVEPYITKDLSTVLRELQTQLETIKSALISRNSTKALSAMDKLTYDIDDLLVLSYFYMDFVHPVFLAHQRGSVLNTKRLLKKFIEKVSADDYKPLRSQFYSLLK